MKREQMDNIDHIEAAQVNLASYKEAQSGQATPGELLRLASVQANLAQAEQLKRLCDLLDEGHHSNALIGVSGHVTSGSP